MSCDHDYRQGTFTCELVLLPLVTGSGDVFTAFTISHAIFSITISFAIFVVNIDSIAPNEPRDSVLHKQLNCEAAVSFAREQTVASLSALLPVSL
jgi:hypothetical protein